MMLPPLAEGINPFSNRCSHLENRSDFTPRCALRAWRGGVCSEERFTSQKQIGQGDGGVALHDDRGAQREAYVVASADA